MKKFLILLSLLSVSILAKDCLIVTSPVDFTAMQASSTASKVAEIASQDLKTFKYKSFTDAYNEFNKETKAYITKEVCEKNNWDGAANYTITWQQTKDLYFFVATFDPFAFKAK